MELNCSPAETYSFNVRALNQLEFTDLKLASTAEMSPSIKFWMLIRKCFGNTMTSIVLCKTHCAYILTRYLMKAFGNNTCIQFKFSVCAIK